MACWRVSEQRHAHAAAESPLQNGGARCTTVKQAVSAQMSRAMQQSADVLLGEDCIVLYHQTSPENAEAIIRSGCMKPGPKFPSSHGGSGLYFAPDPLATTCKANHKGVILECVVSLGRTRLVHKAGDWGSKLRQLLYRYDSVALTFLEGGIEYVIYDPKRVRSLKVHQVLHTSTSSCGISTESSSGGSGSFRIGTVADPGYGSSGTCSGSCSEAGSSGSSVSGDSSDGGAAAGESPGSHARAVCSHQLGSRLRHYAGSATASSSSSSTCSSCSSSSPGCQADSLGASILAQHQRQQQQQSAQRAQQKMGCSLQDSCHRPLLHANLPDRFQQRQEELQQQHATQQQAQQRQQQDAWRGSLGAEHMVVLLADAQQASCGKHLAASRVDSSCRQLVGV